MSWAQCTVCDIEFVSDSAFDAHRVGRYEPDERRCLSLEEMKEKGFRIGRAGRWTNRVERPLELARTHQERSRGST